jgi:hypothetical protein
MTDAAFDVFISYARLDAARARAVRDKLAGLGLSVFFDVEGIDTGAEFPAIIDRAVKGAKCVLGLWSRRAFAGRWVRIESRIGLDQNKLVAALLDDMQPEELPAEFYNVSVESLADFRGEDNHPGWARILRAIGKRVGRADLAGAPIPLMRTPTIALTRQQRTLLLAGAGGAALALLVAFNPFALGPRAGNASESPADSTRPANLTGVWTGSYTEAGRVTQFDLELRTAGDAGVFTGRISEPDIYGLNNGRAYAADISGEARADGSVIFTKSYGGAGVVMRPVRYEGRLSADGRSIAGTWDTGAVQGRFSMQRP